MQLQTSVHENPLPSPLILYCYFKTLKRTMQVPLFCLLSFYDNFPLRSFGNIPDENKGFTNSLFWMTGYDEHAMYTGFLYMYFVLSYYMYNVFETTWIA